MTVDSGLNLAVPPCGNDGDDIPGLKIGQDESGVVSFGGEQYARLCAKFVHDRRIVLHLGDCSPLRVTATGRPKALLWRRVLVEQPPRERPRPSSSSPF